jgi:small subunit ribosomal protein S2
MNIDKPYTKKEVHPLFFASSEINLQNTKNSEALLSRFHEVEKERRGEKTSKQENRPLIKTLRNEFIQDLLQTKGHLGTNNWTENMSKFLLGSRNGISIINLEYTFICLRRVLQFLENMNRYYQVKMQGLEQLKSISRFSSNFASSPHILFVNTHTKYSELVKQAAIQSNQSYINERWIGGTLTNWKQISESILLYNKFSTQFDSFLKLNNIQIPIYQKAKKRYEGLNYSRNDSPQSGRIQEVKEAISVDFSDEKSVFSSSYIPDIIILTNPDQNNIVIKEAQLFKIPIIAFADTNSKTLGIDYIIPGNNKSIYFMYFCLNLITITLQRSKLHREKEI